MAWEKQVSGRQGPASGAGAREFWGWKDGEPRSSLPSLKRGGGARKRRGPDHGSWMCGFGLARAREMFLGPEGRRDLVISFFSPRIRADMPAALVLTEEN